MAETTYSLPPLPYAYDALEPAVSKQIMELHHSKHHQTYVTNLNAALKTQATALQQNDLATQIANLQVIKFHGGGHINHSLFWQNLAPYKSQQTNLSSAPKLGAAIQAQFGNIDAFKAKFNKTLATLQGSGWGWLIRDADSQHLSIVLTKDQDPIVTGEVPIIGIDAWEHAYYLQYLNGKAAYFEAIWDIINWQTAEERFNGEKEDAFTVLKASLKL